MHQDDETIAMQLHCNLTTGAVISSREQYFTAECRLDLHFEEVPIASISVKVTT